MFDYDRFNSFFSKVTPESLDQLEVLYHPDAQFIDPGHRLQGVAEIRAFWQHFVETVTSCETEILHATQHAERCYSRWEMRLRHPRLNKGELFEVAGMSELRVEGDQVIYQRDFYDMGQLLYEHLPVLGSVIRLIKKNI